MKKNIPVVLLFILICGTILYSQFASISNRKERIQLAKTFESEGKIELVQGLVWGLVRDYPSDKEVLRLLDLVEKRFEQQRHEREEQLYELEEERRENEGKWRRVESNFSTITDRIEIADRTGRQTHNRINLLQGRVEQFQSDVAGFQDLERMQWVEQVTARESVSDSDYLYLLLKEKRGTEDRLNSREIDRQIILARESLAKRDYAAAKSQSVRVLRSEPNNATAAAVWSLSTVSLVPEAVENRTVILPVVEYIIRQIPGNVYALETAAIIYRSLGNGSLAEERYRKAYESDPDSYLLQKGYIEVLTENGKFDEALYPAEKIWKNNEKNDETGLLLWRCMANESRSKKIAFLKEWEKSVPKSALPESYLAEIEYLAGNREEAIAYYSAAEKKRASRTIYRRIAEISLELGNTGQAVKYLHAFLNTINVQVESDRVLFATYGKLLIENEFSRKMYADVIADSEKYLKVNPETHEIRFLLGRACEFTGDTSRAITAYERIRTSGHPGMVAIPLLELYFTAGKYGDVKKTGKELMAGISDPELRDRIGRIMTDAENLEKKRTR